MSNDDVVVGCNVSPTAAVKTLSDADGGNNYPCGFPEYENDDGTIFVDCGSDWLSFENDHQQLSLGNEFTQETSHIEISDPLRCNEEQMNEDPQYVESEHRTQSETNCTDNNQGRFNDQSNSVAVQTIEVAIKRSKIEVITFKVPVQLTSEDGAPVETIRQDQFDSIPLTVETIRNRRLTLRNQPKIKKSIRKKRAKRPITEHVVKTARHFRSLPEYLNYLESI